MATFSTRRASVFLRYTSSFMRFRDLPVVGNLFRRPGAAFQPAGPRIWRQIEGGAAADLWISIDPEENSSARTGVVEPPVQKTLTEHLRPGMSFYDLGANFGFFSLIAARLVGPEGRVFAFEPDPVMFERLCQNLQRNGFCQVVVEQKAVWRESTTVPFLCSDLATSLNREHGHVRVDSVDAPNIIRVPAVCLDEYCSSHPAPDFIKCDVEGAEFEMLQGAAETLRQWHPTLVCELHPADNQFELTSYLLEFGYTCHALRPSHLLAVLE